MSTVLKAVSMLHNGNREMNKIVFTVLVVLLSTSAMAGTAFFKYDRVSGMNKICVYDHLGSDVAITIAATQLCPLTIEV